MLHWHGKTCRKPDIAAIDGTVYCARCDKLAPSTTSAAAKPAPEPTARPFRTPLDLNWPSSEQYTEQCILEENGQDLTVDLLHSLGFDSSQAKNSAHSLRKDSITSNGFTPLPVLDTIRIFILSSGAGKDPLHGTLELLTLEPASDFEALSYTWAAEDGDDALAQPLFIGTSWDVLPITANCRNALQRLRSPMRSRKL